MAGEYINPAAGILRSSTIELRGSGPDNFFNEDMQNFNACTIPEMFQLAADGKLTIENKKTALENIKTAWQQEAGKRVVVCMQNII